MNTAVKLIIGLLITIAGIYWYTAQNILGKNPWDSFMTIFVGGFGLFLLLVGLLVTWIEYEDLKWEREEKKPKKK